MSDQKILFISLVTLISLNVFIAPLIDDGEEGITLPDTTPPDYTVLSEDFDPSVETEGGGILEGLANLLVTPVGYIIGTLATIVWFFLVIGNMIFGGTFSHPVIGMANFLISIVVIQTLLKTSDWL